MQPSKPSKPFKRNPDDSGPSKAHNFSVRSNGAWIQEPGGPATQLSERDAWRVFMGNKTAGHVEMLRGPVVVARVGTKAP